MTFIHGLERIPFTAGSRQIQVNRASVIGLIGIAPIGPKNTPTYVYSDSGAEAFGKQIAGYTIPQALDRIFKQGGSKSVIVINIFDEAEHTATITNEVVTTAAQKFALAYAPVGDIVVKSSDLATTYAIDDDYTVDEWGVVTIVNTDDIPNGTGLKVTYDRLDTTAISNADVIGTVTGSVRTGIKAFYDCFASFGFNPKILIAPNFSHIAAITDELQTFADKFFARVIKTKAAGTATAAAITARGTIGDVFNSYNVRGVALFPKVKAVNPRTEVVETVEFDSFFAGVWAKTINDLGYQFSPSNKEVLGISGIELPLTHNPMSPDGTDTNELNSYGITTLGNYFGQGLRIWGNRNMSYPTNTGADSFMSVMITADIIDEAILQASLVFVDLPITTALIDAVRETVNSFLRSLIQRGALVDGTNPDGRNTGCYFDVDKNPTEQIAAGQIVFTVVYCPPTPAERITYDRYIDVSFLSSLTATA